MASCASCTRCRSSSLWGVGRVTAVKLRDSGIFTVRDVADLDERALVSMLGPAAGPATARAGPQSRSPPGPGWTPTPVDRVATGARPPSTIPGRTRSHPGRVGGSRHFAAALRSSGLPDRGAPAALRRLHSRDPIAYLPGADATTLRRSSPRRRSCSPRSRPLIAEAGLTLIGITLANLDHARRVQLELPFRGALLADLDQAMDRIRDRFGTSALTRAALLGRDSGLTVPLLPD